MSDDEIQQRAKSWLTDEYTSGVCINCPRFFVGEVLKMRDTTSKFQKLVVENVCMRDRVYDVYGDRLTCTNEFCKYGEFHGLIV
jgi:hypothetical protein